MLVFQKQFVLQMIKLIIFEVVFYLGSFFNYNINLEN